MTIKAERIGGAEVVGCEAGGEVGIVNTPALRWFRISLAGS